MLAASNSVEQHVYYNDSQAPEKIQSYANPTMGWTAEQESLQELWKTKSVDMNKETLVWLIKKADYSAWCHQSVKSG